MICDGLGGFVVPPNALPAPCRASNGAAQVAPKVGRPSPNTQTGAP